MNHGNASRPSSAGSLRIERGDVDSELLASLFRSAHTIKGGARLLGLQEIAEATEILEFHIQKIRDGALSNEDTLSSVLIGAINRLDQLIETMDIDAIQRTDWSSTYPRRYDSDSGDSAGDEVRPIDDVDRRSSINITWTNIGKSGGLEDDHRNRLDVPISRTAQALGEERLAALGESKRRSETTVRVRTEQIDHLIGLVSEARRLAMHSGTNSGDNVRHDDLTDILGAAEAAALRLRLVPIGGMFDNLRRAVRDSARDDGKEAELSAIGGEVEADASIVDSASEIVLQLVRNAVAHGLETPAERRMVNKPDGGIVRVELRTHGHWLRIIVADDGRGIDEMAVRAQAMERGLDPRRSIRELIFSAGLSTRRTIDSLGGQGIGLDIVKRRCREVGGEVEIDWIPGHGTTFSVRLPVAVLFGRLVVGTIDGRLVGGSS